MSITPASALMGATVHLNITGIGFVEGMTFSIDGGNGPRPVISSVVLTNATDTITTTVQYGSGKNPANIQCGIFVQAQAGCCRTPSG